MLRISLGLIENLHLKYYKAAPDFKKQQLLKTKHIVFMATWSLACQQYQALSSDLFLWSLVKNRSRYSVPPTPLHIFKGGRGLPSVLV